MKIFLFFVLLFLYSCSYSPRETTGSTAQIIFDTDMGPDYDDVGAMAVLHALAARGECRILAVCASDSHPAIAPTIEAFTRYYRDENVLIGAAADGAPGFTSPNHWNDSVVARFLPEPKTSADYPSAVSVYRQVLAGQEDQSVTIVTTGFLSNLDTLLRSGPDDLSPLTGSELVRKKVKKLVAMAGGFPEGNEFNVHKDPGASYYVFNHWPTTILFSGFGIGSKIWTGRRVADEGSPDNPVAWAYHYNLDTYGGHKSQKRNSWDQTAVLCAVRDPEKYFYVNGPGKFIIMKDGTNLWDPDAGAGHYFLSHKYPYQVIADSLDELMMYEP